MSVLAAVLFAVGVFACSAPDGYAPRQKVNVYNASGSCTYQSQQVYHATNMCDAFCICYINDIYYVSKSDKSGYGYMFWYKGQPYYFNM